MSTRLGLDDEPEPTPHICVMGKMQPNVGPAQKTRVPDADGNGCWWMTARNLEKIALAFAKGDLFKNEEMPEPLTTQLEVKNEKEELLVAKGPGIILAPDEKTPAIVFQGTHEGRSAVALVIKGGEQTLSAAGVFNCIDSGNLWADLVEIYRGKTIEKPLEKFGHFTQRTEASKQLFQMLLTEPPGSKESMKKVLNECAKSGAACEYSAMIIKLEELGHGSTASLMREAGQEIREQAG